MNISKIANELRDGIQHGIYRIINPMVKLMIKLGITPNIVTTIGGYIKTEDMEGLEKYYLELEDDCERVNNLYVSEVSVLIGISSINSNL